MWVAPQEGWERDVAFGFYPEGGGKYLKRRHIIKCVLQKVLSAEHRARIQAG